MPIDFTAPEFWVAVSFVCFAALLVYLKVPALVIGALDDRANKIRHELEEAKKLREDAQAMLADYQRKQRDAEKEADAIVVQAREEAKRMAAQTRDKLAASVERRTKLAEEKIARAEAQAIKDVRVAAAELAAGAAEALIASELKQPDAAKLIDSGIKNLKKQLN